MFFTSALIALGIFGLLGMTWLFPCLAKLLWSFKRVRESSPESRESHTIAPCRELRVAILIPAHNEERSIERTLASVQAAMTVTARQATFRVLVGADGCTDRTAELARERGAEVQEFCPQGKWQTLKALVRSCSDVDWVVFADAGIEWPVDFLSKTICHFLEPGLMAVAPSYRISDGGSIERFLWNLERHFKGIEETAGGPVSVHGATVAYRRTELLDTFEALGAHSWLNDDVIIPFTMRSRYPDYRIHYAGDIVAIDRFRASSAKPVRELARRTRLVKGNIQWAPRALEQSGVASVLAFRRLFRLFWAYWLLAFALGSVSLALPLVALVVVFFVATAAVGIWSFRQRTSLVASQGSLSRLLDAAVASLMAPIYLFAQLLTPTARFGRVTWK